jgi:ArsR family transcriptional regulator
MAMKTDPAPQLDILLKQLKALANEKRLRIIQLLMDGVHCNCELGDLLDMSPNLISHHINILRELGLIDVERDAIDARWVYFSINEEALETLNQTFAAFFDGNRIQPRLVTCGPQGVIVPARDIAVG